MEFEDKPKKRRRTSAEVRADLERKEMRDGFIAIMEQTLCVDYPSMGSEGYVDGMYECANRITDAVLNGIKAAGNK